MPVETERNYEVCDLINGAAEERRQRYLTHHLLEMLRQAQKEEIERQRKEEQARKIKKATQLVVAALAVANAVVYCVAAILKCIALMQ